jgi:hypothetical protein
LLQTAWQRTDREEYLRLTRFFGTLLVINVAIGVVTGIVQEFEFGMNWGAYSRLVGNIFGAPLAMEGLAAFFLESTFLGWMQHPVRAVLAEGDDGGRRRLPAAGAGLPVLVVLRVPAAGQPGRLSIRPAHPSSAARAAGRAASAGGGHARAHPHVTAPTTGSGALAPWSSS